MRRRNFEVLIAWLDAVRRRDREAMRALLAPGATWQGIRPEWVCSTPDEVIEMWLERAEALGDLESVELAADEHGAALHVRAPSLAELDKRLGDGVHIAFEIDADGRIARMVDSDRHRPTAAEEPRTPDPRRLPGG